MVGSLSCRHSHYHPFPILCIGFALISTIVTEVKYFCICPVFVFILLYTIVIEIKYFCICSVLGFGLNLYTVVIEENYQISEPSDFCICTMLGFALLSTIVIEVKCFCICPVSPLLQLKLSTSAFVRFLALNFSPLSSLKRTIRFLHGAWFCTSLHYCQLRSS